MSNYILSTVQRSGKTWFCRTLRQLQVLGWPEEYLNHIHKGIDLVCNDRSLIHDFRSDGIQGVISFLHHHTYSNTGRREPVGLAIQWNQLPFLAEALSLSVDDVFKEFVSSLNAKVFYLKRKNVTQQAVSHYISSASGFAHSFQGKQAAEKREKVEFDFDAIQASHDFISSSYSKWESLFARAEIHPTLLHYEDIESDIIPNLRSFAQTIGHCLSLPDEEVRLAAASLSKVSNDLDNYLRQEYERAVKSTKAKS